MDKANDSNTNQKQMVALNIRLKADQIAIYEKARKNIARFSGEIPGASQTLLAGLIAIAENHGGLAIDRDIIKRSANKARHNIADWKKKQNKTDDHSTELPAVQQNQEDDTI